MRKPNPVKASGWIKLPQQLKDIALNNGIYPVNDVFYPVINDHSKILLLYGGYGSGKSVFIVDKLLDECMTVDYFRCFYGRKVFDTIRISVFLTLVDRIDERGLQDQFQYSKAENSSMVITCKKNGNTFNPFGADNPDKLKSVKDPSHILCEEMDQFNLKDFGVLISRLRTPKVKSKLIGLFNTTTVKKDHWIKTVFFSDKTPQEFSEYSITKVFCNYPDNYFLNKREYEQTLWIAAGFNKQKFQEISDGLWGVEENESPFVYTYIESKHVRATKVNPNLEIKLSFDFNCDPITCLVVQDNGIDKIDCIEQIKLANSNIYELCDYIKAKYGNGLMMVTGDATGRARSAMVKDNLNYFKIIKAQLNLGDRQMRQPISNPTLVENRVLVNAAFYKLDIAIDPENCEGLIFDMEHVHVLPDGSIEKQDRKDPKKQQDSLACFRYYLNTFFKHILKIT
jgi:PBSX family phage terminase large subunit